MAKATDNTPQSLAVAVLTVSDTRTEEDDTSGHYLVEALQAQGHRCAAKAIVIDDIYRIRAVLSAWIADEDVDAVVIAAPDHWHAPMAMLAMDAGKHVYVEKPCSYTLYEGRKIVEAARKYDRIVQVGLDRRSDPARRTSSRRAGVLGA